MGCVNRAGSIWGAYEPPSATSILSTVAGAVLGTGAAVGLGVVGGFELVDWAVVELVVAVVAALVVALVVATSDGETAADVGPAVPLDAHADARSVHAAVAMTMVVCCFMDTLCDAAADAYLTVSDPASGRSQVSARFWYR